MLNKSTQGIVAGSLRGSIGNMPSRIRFSAIQWLVLCGVALVIAIGLGTAYFAMEFRQRAIEVAEREQSNTALLLSRHFDQQLVDLQHLHNEVIGYMQAGVGETAADFDSLLSTDAAHEMLRAKLEAMPKPAGLHLYNAAGKLINATEVWPVPDVSIANRRYFKQLTSGEPTPDVVVEPTQSKVSGLWTTVFARKIVNRRGEIVGFASRALPPSHFENFVASLSLGPDTGITVIHHDGTVIARYPQDDKLVGRNVSGLRGFQMAMAHHGNMSGRFRGGMGDESIGAAKPLMHFPIVVVAATKESVALADWRAQTKLQFFAAVLAIVVVIFMIYLIVRQMQRQHMLAQQKLSEKSQHLDVAINNMTQGLLLFDKTGRLVICNQQYIDMFGVSPDVVKPGCHLRELILHRQEQGTFVGDVDSYCAKFLDPKGGINETVTTTPDGRTMRLVYKRSPDGGWATTLEDVTEHRRVQLQIEHLAHYDPLTNLPNRTLFKRHAEGLLMEAETVQFAILYIDIDEFKAINDSLGHLIGDEFLKSVAERLRQSVSPVDFIARLGGDEFAILQHDIESDADVTALVERIYQSLRTPFDCNGHQLSSDASIGVAIAPRHGTDLFGLLKSADLAMYAAKAAGRRTHRFFEPAMEAEANRRREIEQDLRKALAENEFEIHYQPLVDLNSDQVTGCESLLRWRHPVRGMVSPADFIPVAEETGLIEQIGQWVLRTACAEAATWPAHIRIAVNVSPVQFRSETLTLKVAKALAETDLDPRRLELEITEAVLIADDDAALTALKQLRSLGVKIALDDFGTGYSSLQYLQRFPFDKIKIDRSFVKEVVRNSSSASIIRAVVSIAADRDMITTAEGVETLQQRETVQNLGCTQMQGYLFSAARPAHEIRELLKASAEAVADAA